MWLSAVRTDKVSRMLRVTQDDDEGVIGVDDDRVMVLPAPNCRSNPAACSASQFA
jgi:hypothetical protein